MSERVVADGSAPADPLLAALLYVARHHGRAVGGDHVVAGLPLEKGHLTAALFLRAAERANLEAMPVQRPVADIPQIVCPAVLLLSEGVRILERIDHAAGTAIVVDPVSGERRAQTVAELDAQSAGYAFFLRPRALDPGRREVLTQIAKDHWFWSVVRRFKSNYIDIALAALMVNLLALAFPLFVMAVYDRVLPNAAIPSLVALAIGVVLAFVFDVVLRIARSRMIDMTGKQADVVLASNIYEHVLALRMKAKPQSVGVLANQIRDFDSVREFFTSATLIHVTDLLFAFIFIAIMFLIVGPLAWIPLLLLPVIVGIGFLIHKPLDRAMRHLQGEAAARHGVLVESLSGIETIKTLGAEGRMQGQWERSVAAAARSGEDVHYWSSLALTLSNGAQQLAQLGIIVWGVFLVMENAITVGALVAANMLVGRVLGPLTNIAAMLSRGQQALLSLKAIDGLMKLETERPKGKVFTARPVTEGEIRFERVSFAYPHAKHPALREVSFTIRPGERVGIVGRIGAGKTTVGRLLTGLHEPDEGRILIDGVDIRQYDPTDIRNGVGMVLQDVDLFFGTLRDNITVGRPHATDADVIHAARLAGVEEFVAQHPEGYDMPVAEGGRSLSGGQRQAVGLARVLLRKPRIMFMDEPTSALDMRSEAEFCRRLDGLLGRGMTFVVSTHRTSLLRFVDRLLVFDGGQLVADGPRDRVLAELQKRNSERAGQAGAADANL